MPPQAVSLAIFALEEGIKHAPQIYAELQSLFSKSDPTPADWEALRGKIEARTYRSYVPASKLPLMEKDNTPPIL